MAYLLQHLLTDSAVRAAQRPAVAVGEQFLTYAEPAYRTGGPGHPGRRRQLRLSRPPRRHGQNPRLPGGTRRPRLYS